MMVIHLELKCHMQVEREDVEAVVVGALRDTMIGIEDITMEGVVATEIIMTEDMIEVIIEDMIETEVVATETVDMTAGIDEDLLHLEGLTKF